MYTRLLDVLLSKCELPAVFVSWDDFCGDDVDEDALTELREGAQVSWGDGPPPCVRACVRGTCCSRALFFFCMCGRCCGAALLLLCLLCAAHTLYFVVLFIVVYVTVGVSFVSDATRFGRCDEVWCLVLESTAAGSLSCGFLSCGLMPFSPFLLSFRFLFFLCDVTSSGIFVVEGRFAWASCCDVRALPVVQFCLFASVPCGAGH